jgi:hypothetical protein
MWAALAQAARLPELLSYFNAGDAVEDAAAAHAMNNRIFAL